jgi:hypothetical protein
VQDTLTTSAASTGTAPTGGACDIRGLPASTNGIVLAGDMVEINGELKRAIADLNSDAAGLGYLQFEPAMRSAATPDGAAVVFGAPMGKFVMLDGGTQPSRPGYFSDFALTFAEDG